MNHSAEFLRAVYGQAIEQEIQLLQDAFQQRIAELEFEIEELNDSDIRYFGEIPL